jgi:proton glutamate symport protein
MHIGYQVLLAVILGIFSGLFFGPLTDNLKPIGAAYTMLLQMAVLPYICFSLIHGLGSMTTTTGKKILKSGWPFLLGLWIMIFMMIFLLDSIIPPTISSLIKTAKLSEFETNFTQNFLSNIIPQNPFYDIANNIVPAVTVFGLIGGIALMHIEKKEPLISVLERVNQTIERLLGWLGFLAPVGAFVYIAIAFGTIYLEDLHRIDFYVIAFIFTCLFTTFLVLPLSISSLTPMGFKEAFVALRYVCLVPFVTGLGPAALPFLNNYLKKLSKRHETHENFRETSQTILPIAYSFGNIGNAMCLFFILFLSFYYRHPFSGTEKFLLSILTIPLSIGSSTNNINVVQFLIEQLGFSQGALDFFLQIKPFTNNFQIALSIASVTTLIILTIYSYYGLLRVQWKKLLFRVGICSTLFISTMLLYKSHLHISDAYKTLYLDLQLSDVMPNPVQATILSQGQTGEARSYPDEIHPDTLNKIIDTRILKVGFFSDAIPFCYFNNKKELVGFDVAYAYELAKDLNCQLQFIPFTFDHLANDLESGDFDIAMSAVIMNEGRLFLMDFPSPYYEDVNALIVPANKKGQFLDLKTVQKMKGLVIGAGGVQVDVAKRNFPLATIVDMPTFAHLRDGKVDVVLWSETAAATWVLSEPKFIAISYGDALGKSFFSYPVHKDATNFRFFLNDWIALKEQSGFKKRMLSYWIQGIKPTTRPPRWSILQSLQN